MLGSRAPEDEATDLKKVIKLGFDEEAKASEGAVADGDRGIRDCNQWIRYPPLIHKITARTGSSDDD